MSHDRDREHPAPAANPPKLPQIGSLHKPDRIRAEHPSPMPQGPVDPRSHPRREIGVRHDGLRAGPPK